jgi:hypothetical protein
MPGHFTTLWKSWSTSTPSGQLAREATEYIYFVRTESFKRVGFVSDRVWYIVLRGHWCNIVLNVHAASEDKSDDSKDSWE